MSFLAVCFVVLLLFWLFFGLWSGWPAAGGTAGFAPLGNTLIPWLCVAILGYVVFGGGVLPPPR